MTHPRSLRSEPSAGSTTLDADGLTEEVRRQRRLGHRFAGLHATATPVPDTVRLTALVAVPGGIVPVDAMVPATGYPALTVGVPAAFWYERAIHDLFGVVPVGHPRLDPLLLPLPDGAMRPRPGWNALAAGAAASGQPHAIDPDEHVLTRHVLGTGLFTIPHGPVRSGVMESVEYLVETPGEDIPYLRVRPYYKHRGLEKRFETVTAERGVLLAERVEGVASVAHALAYCHAVEAIADTVVPPAAGSVRVVHAELERIANHVDVALRLADAAGLAVAVARFGWHKERLLRLVSRLCGNRFGRGVVVLGGVSAPPRLSREELFRELAAIQKALDPDLRLLLSTSSFLDRLRRTGPLSRELAADHAALGPVGRASGQVDDDRVSRSYDTYGSLEPRVATGFETTDALARLRVRVAEISESLRLVRAAADQIDISGGLRVGVDVHSGRGVGWAEAPQGEVVYTVQTQDGRVTRCAPRSASFHNLASFGSVFDGDILTDFPFIEASFGLSIAGVAA